MVENKHGEHKEPDFVQKAIDELELSYEDRESLYSYAEGILKGLFASQFDPNNFGTETSFDKVRDYAERQSPQGALVARRVFEKGEELKSIYYSNSPTDYSLDS